VSIPNEIGWVEHNSQASIASSEIRFRPDGTIKASLAKGLGKHLRAVVGEPHVSPALVAPNPTESNGALDSGAEVIGAAASRQKRLVDPLDVDASVLYGLDTVRDLDELARGDIRISEGMALDELHGITVFGEYDRLRLRTV